MLRARHAISALLPVIFTVGIGCADEGSVTDDVNATAEVESPMAKPVIIGTFRDEHVSAGVAVLTPKTDWTYHIEKAIVCAKYPCERPQANGLYRFIKLGDANLLMLMDSAGRNVEMYKYLLRENILAIAPNVDMARWQSLTRSDVSWCGVPNDCPLQNLPVGPCAGRWVCPSNACNYTCGPIECDSANGADCPSEPRPTDQ